MPFWDMILFRMQSEDWEGFLGGGDGYSGEHQPQILLHLGDKIDWPHKPPKIDIVNNSFNFILSTTIYFYISCYLSQSLRRIE
jgi:hypothetical protein